MDSQKITGLANASAASDAMNRSAGDARYYLTSDALNTLIVAIGSLDIGGYKLTALGAPSTSTDMSTKQYVDDRVALYEGTV